MSRNLQQKYDEIWEDTKNNILNNNIYPDTSLLDVKNDKKLGISIIAYLSKECIENILKINNELKKIEKNQYFYPQNDLHVTILAPFECHENFKISKKMLSGYRTVVKKVFDNYKLFNIRFSGITGTNGGVITRGFHDIILDDLREDMRANIIKNNLETKETYKLLISHSTIMRFRKPLENPKEFAEKIEELRHRDIGILNVKKACLVIHDWYNIKEKTRIIGEYLLDDL